MQIAFTMTRNSVSLWAEGRMYTVDRSHPNFDELVLALKNGEQDVMGLIDLASVPNYIKKLTKGFVTVTEDHVFYKDEPINDYLSGKIIALYREGFDVKMWLNFVENLMANPIESAREELYLFMESSGLPMTPDGHFLAFKKVQNDYTSYHKGKDGKVFDHTPGNYVEEDEANVDTNRNRTCSGGLHFCSHHYLPHYYGNTGS